jgi:hypothetical protein
MKTSATKTHESDETYLREAIMRLKQRRAEAALSYDQERVDTLNAEVDRLQVQLDSLCWSRVE